MVSLCVEGREVAQRLLCMVATFRCLLDPAPEREDDFSAGDVDLEVPSSLLVILTFFAI